MKIVFLGSAPFSMPSLTMIIRQEDELLAVVTQPDRRRGRGQKVSSTPVAVEAEKAGLTVLKPKRVNDESFVATLREMSPDLMVVVAYGQILSHRVLDIPAAGCINVHASLLPKYRGAAPVEWAVIRGEKVTGVTTMLMNEGVDTGPILMSREVAILPGETAGQLSQRLSLIGAEVLQETLEAWKRKTLRPRPQDTSAAVCAPSLRREDARIRWDRTGKEIVNLIRGTNPRPGAHTMLEGRLLKIFEASFLQTKTSKPPGSIVQLSRTWLKVACGDGYVYVKEVQPENRRKMPVEAFLAGARLKTGMVLE
ncbi:MAG: methionyl-tRNA formyltransferase [Deltaproteobacteria bacterium]|nr:methionyl-tRNA formyltransferase [Deltaproteobacteria bacterium]